MSSYFDSLQSWKEAGDAINQHRTDMEKQLNNAKAEDINDKYSHIQNVINEAGGSIGGFGGAFHLGRKVYKKVKAAKAKVQEAKNTFEDLKGKMNDVKSDVNSTLSGTKATPENINSMGKGESEAGEIKSGGPTTAEPSIDETPDYASRATDRILGGDKSASHSAEDSQKDLNPQGETKAAEGPVGEAGEAEKIVGGDVKENVMGGLKDMGDDLKDNVLKKVGSYASKGLEEASGALEFLGPVGEVVGAGLALGGLFRNIFEHKKLLKQEDKASLGRGDLVESSGGLSQNNLASASKLSSTVGTIL